MKQFTLPLLRGIYLPEQKGFFESLELRGEAAKPMHIRHISIDIGIVSLRIGTNTIDDRQSLLALRDGKIRRSTLNQIVPEFKLKLKDGAKTIEMLRHSISGKYTTFDTMTIRQYCRFFRAADEKFFHIEHNSDLSDIEYYKRHKGYSEMDELDMDSEADFRKIAEDHYGELGLSRCNVCAHKRRDGKWKITLSLGYYHHLTNILETATACYEEGLAMEISCAKKMLDIIKERDYVGFTSSSFHQYLGDEEVGNEIELDTDLYDIEDPKRRRAAQRAIIKAAEWSPLEQVSCDEQ